MSLRDRVAVVVEAGYRGESVGTFQWDVSSWDAVSWGGIEPTWIALDGWTVERVRTKRGRDRANRRHPAGTAQVVLVYRTPAGAWSFRPTSPIALGQEVRVRVRPYGLDGEPLTDDLVPIYRGAIRQLADEWTPASPDRPGVFRLTVALVDRMADLAAVDLPEQGSAAGLDDTTDERLARILDLASIDTFYLRAAIGVVHHQSSTFARNLLDEAQVAVESENGALYVDREGFLVMRERLGTGSYPREDDVQLTWANDGTAGAIAPTEFGTTQDLDDVVNQVSYARAGGTAYTVTDTDSRTRYGLRTYQRFDLTCRYDADVEDAADYWLAQLATRTQRIDKLQAKLNPRMADDELLQLIDVELGDRHAVSWSDGERVLAGEANVQGIAHDIAGDEWSIDVRLWSYAGDELIQEAGLWGTGVWGGDVWGA